MKERGKGAVRYTWTKALVLKLEEGEENVRSAKARGSMDVWLGWIASCGRLITDSQRRSAFQTLGLRIY